MIKDDLLDAAADGLPVIDLTPFVDSPGCLIPSNQASTKVGARKTDHDIPFRPDHLDLQVDLARRHAQVGQPCWLPVAVEARRRTVNAG
jgi:hypothetical protein